MTTTPTPSEPRDENAPPTDSAAQQPGDPLAVPASASAKDAPEVEPHAEPALEGHDSTAVPPAAKPQDDGSRWAPPPARPTSESPAAATPAASSAPAAAHETGPAPELVEPAPAADPSASDRDVDAATYDAEMTEATPAGDATTVHEPVAHEPAAHDAASHDSAAHVAAERDRHDEPVAADSAVDPATATAPTAALASAPAPSDRAPTDENAPAATAAAAADPQVVYVPSPTPPRKKGNRGMGVGIALISTPIFAAVYAALALLFVAIANNGIAASEALGFFSAPVYWLPIIAFALFYVLLALIVNRAGWWAHVLGGFIVALLVYVTFLVASVLTAEPLGVPAVVVQEFIAQQLTNPIGWAAAIAAREVPIWVGGLVAKRGRSVKSRNVEAREAYERELAESRASRPTVA